MESLQITWDTLLKIGAGLIVLFEFGKWIVSFGNPIVELKKRVDAHDRLFANDKSHLDKVDKGIARIDEGVSILGRALSEMMKHEITGNDIQALREQQRRVNDYFYETKRSDDED